MAVKYPNLFSPIVIRGNVFKNRILSAPLGAWFFSPDNYIFDYAISSYEEKAKGGAAAVCIGHTEVNYMDEDTDGFGLYFNFRKREGTAAATTFVQTIQQYGCHASVELNYGGLYKRDCPDFPGQKITYDALRCDGPVVGKVHPLTKEKLQEIKQEFVECVEKMRICGFHMVTIHGAHGWLLNQLLLKENNRNDEYGGCFENRIRFPLELLTAVREAAGRNMIVDFRISGLTPEDDPEEFENLITFLNRLEGIVDIINISAGSNEGAKSKTFPSYLAKRGIHRDIARAIKPRVPNIPIAIVGAISSPEMAEEIIATGEADFVAMCRALIADPQWPNKAQSGKEDDIRPCVACYNCLDQMHLTHFLGCDINPKCGMEHRIVDGLTSFEPKTVLVVGGGPAGMNAAITASDKGHKVILVEKSAELGGLLKLTDGDKIKWMLNNYKNYLIRQVNKRNIEVIMNTEVTEDFVKRISPDYVLVASGSTPLIPKIPGVDLPHVYNCISAHENIDKLGKNVVIIGGNMVGCEYALYFKTAAEREVTVIEMTDTMHVGSGMAGPAIDEMFDDMGIIALTGTKCVRIEKNAVIVEKDGKELSIACDTVVLAVGMKSNYQTYERLRLSAPIVQPIGDCLKVETVRNASRTAFFAANNI